MSDDDMPFSDSFLDRLPVLIAVVLSALWVAVVALYVRDLAGGLRALTPAEAAGLLAGAGGPIAAFWLFMSVMEQRRRLVMLTHAMGEMMRQHRHTLQLAETQTRTLVEFQAQSKRARTAETRQLVFQDLAAQVAVLAERLGVIRRENMDVAWARFGSGDMTAFVQPFLNFVASHPDMGERLGEAVTRDPIAATALHGFMRRFERLVAESADDRMANEIIDEGALGRAYRLFKTAASAPAPRPAAADVAAAPPRPAVVAAAPPPAAVTATPATTPKSPPAAANVAAATAPEPPATPPPQTVAYSDELEARLLNLSERLDASAHKAILPGI